MKINLRHCMECGSRLSNKKLRCSREGFEIPFSCKTCSSIKFNYHLVRDVLAVWKYPAPEKIGSIFLPEDSGYRGSLKEELRPSYAIVLGIGPGYFDNKKQIFVPTSLIEVGDEILFNKNVPWNVELKNDEGVKYIVTFCGFGDIFGITT